jgi:hypothetical protein
MDIVITPCNGGNVGATRDDATIDWIREGRLNSSCTTNSMLAPGVMGNSRMFEQLIKGKPCAS